MNTKAKILLTSALALAGLSPSAATLNTAVRAHERNATQAVNNGSETNKIEADAFGSYAAGILRELRRDRGNTPYEWGISRQCARMVRKNKLHRGGVSHARI